MWDFVPDDKQTDPFRIPYFEDARSDFAPYYASDKSEGEAKSEVAVELSKLGAVAVTFQAGHFISGDVKRHGYHIRFQYRGAPALIKVAGLPMRSQSDSKLARVRAQALLVVRDWFKSAVTSRVFAPGNDVLVPYMLVDAQQGVTIGELMGQYAETGNIPKLPERSQGREDAYEEGEFRESE